MMYFDDHDPPHFHAVYAGKEAQVGIDPIVILEGDIPNRAASMVVEWAALHQRALMQNWRRLRNDQPDRKDSTFGVERHVVFPRVTQVRHMGRYRLELRFSDGVTGELNFEQRVVGRGGVFRPLEDVGFFRQVKVDPEAGTIVWPNEVDFCPDVLYSLVTGKPIRVLEPA